MRFTRRSILQFTSLAPFVAALPARADARVFRHGSSLIGEPKYAPGFAHFDYVNVAAPKGGRVRLATLGSFDSINPFTIKGDSINPGVNETLMKPALDEASSAYGLLADGLWYPDDYSQVVYRLRPEAQFSDGEPVKPSDVIFSFQSQKANNTQIAAYYKDVEKVEQTGEHEVTFVFSKSGNRELPHIVGELAVLPQHWWTAKDANGKPRDVSTNTLEPLLGSGPYVIAAVKPGQSILLKRAPNYWGKSLGLNQGVANFDEVETQLYQDRAVLLEAFKGDQFDIQFESSSKQWAQGYDFPAAKDGRVRREELPKRGVQGMQAWCVNLRRPKFADMRVRQALDLAFDFEWSNANLFYGLYNRSRSYFNNSELEAKGLPSAGELKLLTPLKDKIPAEVFTTEYAGPNNATPQDRRKNLRLAQQLLADAGWKPLKEGNRQVLKNAKGETFSFTITLDSPAFERIALPYKEQLGILGFDVEIRTLDAAQYERINGDHDYDMIVGSWGQSLSPGNEQRDFFSSALADKTKGRNFSGIKDPAVDAIVEALVTAPDRDSLVAACRALDRVLMWNHFVIPMWFKATDWLASWTRVAHPKKMPGYSLGYPDIWWFDADADARLKKA